MSEYKFNIGDRVRNLKYNGIVKEGAIGSVVEEDDAPFVDWDSLDMVNDKIRTRWARNEDYLELILPASLKVGDTVKTPDGIGTVISIRETAFKYPNQIGLDVKVGDEVSGWGVDDLCLPEEADEVDNNWFKVASASITYRDSEGNELTISSVEGYPKWFDIKTNSFVFDETKRPDDVIADFKRRVK